MIYYIRNVDGNTIYSSCTVYNNKDLFDEAMSDMKIYLVEPRNMRRGAAELHILGETK